MNDVLLDLDKHVYTEGGREYKSVTWILNHFGMMDLSMVRKDVLEEAQKFGTNFHILAELYEEDRLESYDPSIEPWLNGLKKFLKEMKPEVIAIELAMVSKTWWFAGKTDRIYRINGVNGVWDFKTGQEYPANELQTAGYKILAEESLGLKIKERGTIRIFENGYKLHQHTNPIDENIFKGLANAVSWKQKKGLL